MANQHRVLRFICLAAFFIFLSRPFFAFAENGATGVDAVLIIDVSGSMRYSDSKRAALQSANMFIDLLETEYSRVGVIAFNDTIVYEAPLTPLSDASAINAIKTAVSRLTYYNFTDIGRAMLTGARMIDSAEESDNRPMIIMLTDGMTELRAGGRRTIDDSTNDLNEAFTILDGNVPVFTIGLEREDRIDIDKGFLEDIAARTRAESYIAASGAELPQVYSEIFEKHVIPALITAAPEEADDGYSDETDEAYDDAAQAAADETADTQAPDAQDTERPVPQITEEDNAASAPDLDEADGPGASDMSAPETLPGGTETPTAPSPAKPISAAQILIGIAGILLFAGSITAAVILTRPPAFTGALEIRAMTNDGLYTETERLDFDAGDGLSRITLDELLTNGLSNKEARLLAGAMDIGGVALRPGRKNKSGAAIIIKNNKSCEFSDDTHIFNRRTIRVNTGETINLADKEALSLAKFEITYKGD